MVSIAADAKLAAVAGSAGRRAVTTTGAMYGDEERERGRANQQRDAGGRGCRARPSAGVDPEHADPDQTDDRRRRREPGAQREGSAEGDRRQGPRHDEHGQGQEAGEALPGDRRGVPGIRPVPP